jgi:hypothetical protein
MRTGGHSGGIGRDTKRSDRRKTTGGSEQAAKPKGPNTRLYCTVNDKGQTKGIGIAHGAA